MKISEGVERRDKGDKGDKVGYRDGMRRNGEAAVCSF